MKALNLTLPRFCFHRHTSDWLRCQGWEDNKSRIHCKMPSRMSRCKIPCLWHRHLCFFFQCVQCCNSQVSGLNWARHPERIITHGFSGPSKFPVPCKSVCRLLFWWKAHEKDCVCYYGSNSDNSIPTEISCVWKCSSAVKVSWDLHISDYWTILIQVGWNCCY